MSIAAASARRSRLLLALLVGGLALWPRLWGAAPAPTWDELFWTHGALRFHSALATARWSRTYIIGQPGVVPLWVWSGQLALRGASAGPAERAQLLDLGDRLRQSKYPEGNLAAMRQLGEAWHRLALGRGTAWASALLCALVAWLLAGRFGLPAAALAGLRLAWDPYLLAHGRVVALDAMLAGLCLLAVTLAAAAAARRRGEPGARGLLAAGGVAAGLAMLAKLPGGVALAWGALWLLIAEWTSLRRAPAADTARVTPLRALVRPALWVALALGSWLAAWPAMWDVPLKTLGKLRDTLVTYQQTAYDSMFFIGQAGLPPGPLFYPAVLLWRALPLTLLGLLLLVLALARSLARAARGRRAAAASFQAEAPRPGQHQHLPDSSALAMAPAPKAAGQGGQVERAGPAAPRNPARTLPPPLAAALPYLGFALCYGAALSLADSKFERYLLPALAAANLAVGLAAGLALSAWRQATGHRLPALLLGGLLLAEPLLGRGWQDGLAWYNPLVGGARTAEAVLPAGWGEGTEQATSYLAALPGAAQLTVASEGMVSLLPAFPGNIVRARGQACAQADFVLVYVFDRQLQAPAARAYAGQEPVFVGRVRGRPWLWLYRGGRACEGG